MFTLDKRFSSLIIGLLLLIFAACTPKSGSIPNTGERPTPAPQSSLANTKWTLVSFGHVDGEMPVVNGSTVGLQFDAEGQVVGSGGCNSYSAHYEVQGNMLSVGEITRTSMACQSEGIWEQEQHFFQSLETAGRFELSGDRLTIWYEDGQGVLNWVALNSDPTATLRPSVTTEPPSTQTANQSTPTPERIDFGAGTSSTTLTGTLQASGSGQYVLSALGGQTMTLDLSLK